MANIVLTRIDDRLIHGQVMTAWVHHTKGNHILIVDDLVAQDEFLKSIMSMSIPPNLKLDVLNEEEGIAFLKNASDDLRIIVLVKTPEVVEKLVNNGIEITELIVGGMGAKESREKLYKNISASSDEKQTFKKLIEKGVKVEIQIVPENAGTDIGKYL